MKKSYNFFGLLDRCRILWGIYFSHPRSDLRTSAPTLSEKYSFFRAISHKYSLYGRRFKIPLCNFPSDLCDTDRCGRDIFTGEVHVGNDSEFTQFS